VKKIFDVAKRKRADREMAVALAKSERALSNSELDQVAAAGGTDS
jgi:hypothetical protein